MLKWRHPQQLPPEASWDHLPTSPQQAGIYLLPISPEISPGRFCLLPLASG